MAAADVLMAVPSDDLVRLDAAGWHLFRVER